MEKDCIMFFLITAGDVQVRGVPRFVENSSILSVGLSNWMRHTFARRISGETDPRSILEIKPLESIVGAVSNA